MNEQIDMIWILAPAFVAGALISLTHVPFGIEVLKRGIIFLDLAIAQCAALGMIAFHVYIENEDFDLRYSNFGALLCGLGAALLCAITLHAVEKKSGKYQEALIGCTFVFAASLSILIMSGNPHSGEQMKDILAGQILWVNWSDLYWSGPVFIATWLAWTRLSTHRNLLFYPLFALTIPFSVNLIGVYLVFASLILPALATVSIQTGRAFIAYLLSLLSFVAGLFLSYIADLPSGPAIVLSLMMLAILFFLSLKKRNWL